MRSRTGTDHEVRHIKFQEEKTGQGAIHLTDQISGLEEALALATTLCLSMFMTPFCQHGHASSLRMHQQGVVFILSLFRKGFV